MLKYTTTISLLGLLLALIYSSAPPAVAQRSVIDEISFAGSDFPTGAGDGFGLMPTGLTLDDTAVTAIYTSPIIAAPIPFNALFPQWQAEVPDGASLEILARTASADNTGSEWHTIHPQPDWIRPEDTDIVGEMLAVPAADVVHHAVQFRVAFGRYQGMAAPVLRQLRFTFIDSTQGPTTAELIARQEALNDARGETAEAPTSYPKPFVVSREVWCTHPDCVYYDGLEYYPVSHLILHHTASSNNSSDWAATLRAIWDFHTHVRGWGDIGYNYLVDMNGVLYEGHRGGDDVVGTHSGGANTGSMALSLMGTFTRPDQNPPGITPPAPMLNAAIELFAWKADQRGINVYDANSALPNIDWGLPCLMGHRDVYGGTNTACPGDQAHVLLPWLRDQVAMRIGLVSPHVYIDELSGAFTRSNNGNWFVPGGGCGHNGHAYYTWSTTDPAQSTNWGEWRPNVPGSGRYEIQVYAPYCITGKPETQGARYEIHHAAGISHVTVNQDANVGLWMTLGTFDLVAGNNTMIRLTDLTTTDSGRGVWFDAIRLRPVDVTATVTNEQPTDGWQNTSAVDFVWTITNPTTVQATRLLVATDPGFTNVVVDQSWPSAVTNYNHTFTQDYADLYWLVLLTTPTSVVGSTPTHFRLDATPPTSAVATLFQFTPDGPYYVYWSGSDNLSGIVGYNVDLRAEDEADWQRWINLSPAHMALFVPPDGRVYWFRSQAIDAAGNVEPSHPDGDRNTQQAILLSHAIMLPVTIR